MSSEQTTGTRSSGHRINAVLTDKGFKTLQTLAEERGKTYREVLTDALALEMWFYEAREEGARLLVERNGELREVVPWRAEGNS